MEEEERLVKQLMALKPDVSKERVERIHGNLLRLVSEVEDEMRRWAEENTVLRYRRVKFAKRGKP